MAPTKKKGDRTRTGWIGALLNRLRSRSAIPFEKQVQGSPDDSGAEQFWNLHTRRYGEQREALQDQLEENVQNTWQEAAEQVREHSPQIPQIVYRLPDSPLDQGKIIHGIIHGMYDSYTIQERISHTFASRVYKAKSQGLGIDMVVKQYLKEEIVHGFSRESDSHNRLYYSGGHANIIPAYEFLVTEDDNRLGVFPYVTGETLDKIAAREGQFSLKQVLPLVLPVCDALEHTHNLGIVHRDVKPDNIIISASAEVNKKLLETYPNAVRPMLFDYGLSSNENLRNLDEPGTVAGTFRYIAPELWDASEERGLEIPSKARDIYAFGVMLYQLVAGRFPFNGRTDYDLVQAHRYAPVPDITQFNSTVTADAKYVVEKMLKKDPEQRYHTMAALKQDLKALQ